MVLTGGSATASVTMQETTTNPAAEATRTEEIVAVEEAVVTSDANAEEATTLDKSRQQEKADELKEKDSFGGALTIMSMCIVLLALIILSLLFLGFGKVASKFQSKKKREATGVIAKGEELHDDHEALDSGEVIAAIAMALDEHFGGKHDIENTILTLRRMKRAYSPWNSKIYNLREVPQVRHHAVNIAPAKNIK